MANGDTTVGPKQTTPPPEPALPPSKAPTHTVKEGETLDSIAKAHGVTPQELAAANGLPADADIEPHQTLELPANAKLQDNDSAAGLTPQQRTDAAWQKYQAAQQRVADDKKSPAGRADLQQDQATLAQARQDFEDAVEAEITTKVDAVNQGVPPEYRTPESKLVQQYQAQIAARCGNDANAKSAIGDAAADYRNERKAQELVPYYSDGFSAAEKLKGIDLSGQPQAVIDKVLADPRVQQWIKDAAKEAAGKSPADTAKYLADLCKENPQLGAQVVRQWWTATDTQSVQSTSSVAAQAANDPEVFKNLSEVYASLEGTPGGEQVQDYIASTIAGQQKDNPQILAGTINRAFDDGADPRLTMAVASQMEVQGNRNSALSIAGTLTYAARHQQQVLQDDMKKYGEVTAELNWYINSLGPSMTEEQKQAAIKQYVESKGEGWKKELEEAKNRIVEDGKRLNETLTLLDQPPEGTSSTVSQLSQSVAKQIGEDESTQRAIEFAASQDPKLFEGEEGESAAKFWIEVGHKSKDFTAAIAQSYVAGHVLPELEHFNPNDPASVARAHQALEDLRGKATLLGIDKKTLDAGIDKLETLVDTLKTENLQDAINGKGINAIGKVKSELAELGTLNSGPAGLLFRTVAFGLTGAALINAAGETVENPSFQNLINDVGLTLGFAQDSAALAAKAGLVDKAGSLGGWGLRNSPAGEATEKFVGALGVAYYLLGAGEAAIEKDAPAAAFNLAAAAGIGLATFVDASWAGPVGWGVALVSVIGLGWYEHVKEANKYEPENDGNTVPFLKHAGFSDAAAHELANQSGDGYSVVPALARYAEASGYDLSDPAQQKTFVDWINNLPTDKLATLRDQLHETLDANDGDIDKAAILVASADLGPSTSKYTKEQLAAIGLPMLVGQLALKDGIPPLPQGPNYGYTTGSGEPA